MSLSERAQVMKKQMSGVVTLRREWEAMREEWRQMARSEECWGEEFIWQLLLEKRALQRELAKAGLRNMARLQRSGLNERRRQLLYMRYVQGRSWADIVQTLGKSKQYVLREHNRALEQVVKRP
ncbi:MAG: hypothetical protein IJO59_00355 [Clostridia bacterium]|nr:hypothetical protein [Clostridia bacterium]